MKEKRPINWPRTSDQKEGILIQEKDVFVELRYLPQGDAYSSKEGCGLPRIRVYIMQDRKPNDKTSDWTTCVKVEDFFLPTQGFNLTRAKRSGEGC